jgi:cytochrome bd-type quinol oxidase subunit 2
MTDAPQRDINSGPGRVLVGLYGLFALSAGARAGVQIATKFHVAPLAYLLSAVSAAIYLVATIALVRGGRGGRALALVCCSVELAGVLVVGAVSLLVPAAFPDATVWSAFGRGYGFIPLVLPVLGLLWLRSVPPSDPPEETPAGPSE